MRRLFPLVLLLTASLTFPACDVVWDHDGGDDDPTTVLLPLDIGNAWTMAFTRTAADGTVLESSTDTLRVVTSDVFGGETWFEVRSTISDSNVLDGWYTNREDGVWRWNNPLQSDRPPRLYYKYPATQGDTYGLPGHANLTVTVLDTDAEIKVPAGTIEAYEYEFDTDEAYGHPVSDGAARFLRYLVPGQGFADMNCSFLTLTDEGEFVLDFTLNWKVIAFEG